MAETPRCDTCRWWRELSHYVHPPKPGRCHRELSGGGFSQTEAHDFCRHHEAPPPPPAPMSED